MISPEILRRFQFFSFLEPAQYKQIAMLSNEFSYSNGEVIYNTDEPADSLHFLINGYVDLWYVVADKNEPDLVKEFQIGEVNPGEAFGISALVEPYVFTTRAVSIGTSRVIKIDSVQLRELFPENRALGCGFMTAVAKTAMERLQHTRVQLAAAR